MSRLVSLDVIALKIYLLTSWEAKEEVDWNVRRPDGAGDRKFLAENFCVPGDLLLLLPPRIEC